LERNKIAKDSHEFKSAEQYSASQYEAISKSLDEFASRIIKFNVEEQSNGGDIRYLYQQVIFSE